MRRACLFTYASALLWQCWASAWHVCESLDPLSVCLWPRLALGQVRVCTQPCWRLLQPHGPCQDSPQAAPSSWTLAQAFQMRGAHLVSAASPWLALGLQVTHLALAASLLPPLTVCCGAPKPSLMRGLQVVRPVLSSARLAPMRADCAPVLRCGPEGADLQLAELERKRM